MLMPCEGLIVCCGLIVSCGLIVPCEGNAVGAFFRDPKVFRWYLQPHPGRDLLESILPCLIAARAQAVPAGDSISLGIGSLVAAWAFGRGPPSDAWPIRTRIKMVLICGGSKPPMRATGSPATLALVLCQCV